MDENKDGKKNNQRLWNLSEDSMRQHLKKRLYYSGYPTELFGFHSLRSGMLCSALLHSNTEDLEVRRSVLEATAIIAGWVPNSKVQMIYVKECMKR